MKFNIDYAVKSCSKNNDRVCGDTTRHVETDDMDIYVLSDGIGSGVRAKILSTVTTTLFSTMLQTGSSVDDCITEISRMLAMDASNRIAYSTFVLLTISRNGRAKLTEYDSPKTLFYRDGKLLDVNYTCREVAGMKIREYNFVVHVNDCFVLMSDGVTHAGMPDVYPFGWGRTRVAEYVSQLIQNNGNVCMRIATAVIGQCREIYRQVPGDDATAMVVSVGKDQRLNILTGPPSRDELDEQFIHDFIGQSGLHVIAGGTSACIASRVLNRQLKVSLDYMDPDIPPVAQMEGIDLVIEGILTLNRTLKFLLRYNQGEHNRVFYKELDSKDGAARLAKMIIEQCVSVSLFVGKTVNTAYQPKELPLELGIRMQLVARIAHECRKMGKRVEVKYY